MLCLPQSHETLIPKTLCCAVLCRMWGRQAQRLAALNFVGALVLRLGPEKVSPFLPVLLRPLYRITEAGDAAAKEPEEVGILNSHEH